MLNRQREDEIEIISRAVLTEVAVLSKYLIGHLGLCEMIQQGFEFPRAQLGTVILTPEPIIYRSVADKITRLPRPTQVVSFYTRMTELDGIGALITNSPSETPNITPNEISGLVNLLITQCQEAQAILSNVASDPVSEAVLANRPSIAHAGRHPPAVGSGKGFFPKLGSIQVIFAGPRSRATCRGAQNSAMGLTRLA